MAKKKKIPEKETTIENYYELKTKEIDDLVAALKDEDGGSVNGQISTNIAEITGEEIKAKPGSKKAEFDPYKTDWLGKVPVWIKALFVKFWFAGLVCWFISMGLGYYITDALDILVLDGIVLGLITDLMVNPILRYMESPAKEFNNYMMFPFPLKQYWTFFTNIIYYIVVMFGVNGIYLLLDGVWNLNIYLEPLLFGLFSVIVDMVFIGLKDLAVYLIRRAKNKKRENATNV